MKTTGSDGRGDGRRRCPWGVEGNLAYLTYHDHLGSKPFPRHGWIRPVYYTILITHVTLAAAILPLALVTLYRAWRQRFDHHRRIARWTLPIWLYVSVTGVVVYVMLYQL
jgi:uncharacterized membrane protein YozB (DUF420 family)